MTPVDGIANRSRDLVRRPVGRMVWWGLPILIGVSTNFAGLSLPQMAFVWAGAFAWMGTGCLLNALRCARLHCFISAPVLWLGAVAAGSLGVGLIEGTHMLNNIVSITAVVVLLSFVPEFVWGKYAKAGTRAH